MPLLSTRGAASAFGWITRTTDAGPAFELISTTILSSSASSVTFASVPQTYKHLQLRWTGRNSESWGATGLANGYWLRINGITSASYSTHSLEGNGSSVGTSAYSGLGYIRMTRALANSYSPLYAFTGGVADFFDYTNTSVNKTMKALTGYVSNSTEKGGITVASGALHSTGAINSITIGGGGAADGSGTFVAGSRFSLYGIKG